MRIGKKLHTENKKKVYRKPVVEVVEVDRVISLGSPSLIGEPAPSDPQDESKTNEKKQIFQESKDPFGGGTPDYER